MKLVLGMEVGLSPGDFVLDGDPAPPPQKGGFSADVYCGQTAGWMRVVIGMEVGLNPGNFVLDGDPVFPPQQRGRSPLPIFGTFLLCPNGWMHQDATWYGGRPQPRRLCVRWKPRFTLPQRGQSPPTFRPMFIAAKWMDG